MREYAISLGRFADYGRGLPLYMKEYQIAQCECCKGFIPVGMETDLQNAMIWCGECNSVSSQTQYSPDLHDVIQKLRGLDNVDILKLFGFGKGY